MVVVNASTNVDELDEVIDILRRYIEEIIDWDSKHEKQPLHKRLEHLYKVTKIEKTINLLRSDIDGGFVERYLYDK